MKKGNRPRGGGRLEAVALGEAELQDAVFNLPLDVEAIQLAYALPRLWRQDTTVDEFERAYMQDLSKLSPFRLWQEEVRVTLALAFCDMEDPDHERVARWLKLRLAAIRQERGRRRHAQAV